MKGVTAEQIQTMLDRLAAISLETPGTADTGTADTSAFVTACWSVIDAPDRPAFFRLLELAADLPRLSGNRVLADLPPALWPQLSTVADSINRLQTLVDQPIVPIGSLPITVCQDVETARHRLDDHHCATIDSFLDSDQQARLDAAIERLRAAKQGTWGPLTREEGPDVYRLMEAGLASPRFRRMTGYDPARDTFSLTLSLQHLDPAGIGWHRDLYWPAEWVGQDVFAVFHALASDSPKKGGAFVYYLPWSAQIHHFYRQRHQTTVLWNSADPDGRILHAVAGYHGDDTERHLIILQCLRRTRRHLGVKKIHKA